MFGSIIVVVNRALGCPTFSSLIRETYSLALLPCNCGVCVVVQKRIVNFAVLNVTTDRLFFPWDQFPDFFKTSDTNSFSSFRSPSHLAHSLVLPFELLTLSENLVNEITYRKLISFSSSPLLSALSLSSPSVDF